jgi:Zn-dependent peptidase ImmA (M78 family)/transcriptional regulator with XRE-family HTH domain
MEWVADWPEVGERVRQARLASGLTQAQLAGRVGLERSALARVEGGSRQVDALELFRLSDVLGVPIGHFVSRPPAEIVARRSALADEPDLAARERFLLDADLEAHLRDTDWLARAGLLVPAPAPSLGSAATPQEARELAGRARDRLAVDAVGPVGSMTEVCEAFGLFVLVVDRDADGASLRTDGFGVAVIGGRTQPGRRRFTAAHELGHHLLGDAYHSDVGVAASLDEREQVINAFAAELLLPEAAVRAVAADGDVRDRLVVLAGSYRVSWSVVVAAARRGGLLQPGESQRLRAATPRRGEFLALLASEPAEDLRLGEVGPVWRKAVLAGWQQGVLTAARAVELLHGEISVEDLPERIQRAAP